MSSQPTTGVSTAAVTLDGFGVLDECHRQTLVALGQLDTLVSRLKDNGPDDEARTLADKIIEHFSFTARRHHEDEERYVFPQLVVGGDPATVQAVLRLQQDHNWIEEDWMELSAHLEAVASGRSWCDVDLLREGAEIFSALLHEHIALEESFIYPQARARLRPGEVLDIGRTAATRRRVPSAAKRV